MPRCNRRYLLTRPAFFASVRFKLPYEVTEGASDAVVGPFRGEMRVSQICRAGRENTAPKSFCLLTAQSRPLQQHRMHCNRMLRPGKRCRAMRSKNPRHALYFKARAINRRCWPDSVLAPAASDPHLRRCCRVSSLVSHGATCIWSQ